MCLGNEGSNLVGAFPVGFPWSFAYMPPSSIMVSLRDPIMSFLGPKL